MSRALNVNATLDHVSGVCAKHKAAISTIEMLRSGGTRVVLKTADSAAVIRRAYGSKVIDQAVVREPMRLKRFHG